MRKVVFRDELERSPLHRVQDSLWLLVRYEISAPDPKPASRFRHRPTILDEKDHCEREENDKRADSSGVRDCNVHEVPSHDEL